MRHRPRGRDFENFPLDSFGSRLSYRFQRPLVQPFASHPRHMLASAATLLILTCFSAALAFSPSFPYGSATKVRGVNIGGWLVLEPWINPSVFENTGNPNIVDEWTFGQLQDRNTAQRALTAHWDSWITESDFAAIAAAGYAESKKSPPRLRGAYLSA